MTTDNNTCHRIKNILLTIESEVSWSSLLSFYTLEEQSFQHREAGAISRQRILQALKAFNERLRSQFKNLSRETDLLKIVLILAN